MSRSRALMRFRDPASRGVLTSSGALLVTLIVQVASVPLFLSQVGVERYAAWLVLTALPTYLSLISDLGFSGAAATDASRALTQGEPARASRILSSARTLVTLFSITLLAIGVAVAFALVREGSFSAIGAVESRTILIVLLLSVAVSQQSGFFEAALRVGGKFPVGITILSGGRLAELLGIALVLVTTQSLVGAAVAIATVRLLTLVGIRYMSRRLLPWLALSYRGDRAIIRTLIGPSLTYCSFAVGAALSNQGFVILLSREVSAESLVAFTTVRTLVNLINQVVIAIANGTLAELTFALARRDRARARRLYVASYRASYALGFVACLALGTLGQKIIELWTSSAVSVSTAFLVCMALVAFSDILWRLDVNVLRAENAHGVAGVSYVSVTVLSLLLATWTVPSFGLLGAALALAAVPILVTPIAHRKASSQLRR